MINMRPFNAFEQRNLRYLVNLGLKFTQVEITSTGLKKSILDATAPMRTFFVEEGIHNYEDQLQGPDYKHFYSGLLFSETSCRETKISFYRPTTKQGDPRLWIYGFGGFTEANDIHILFHYQKKLCVANLTKIDFKKCYESRIITPLQEVLADISRKESAVAEQLLKKFRKVSNQWFLSEVKADTGIGRSIETYLGIKMNSDKSADYKGIEIKSHRDKRSSKKNVLFTQTPNWALSNLKSGREIVAKYGYMKNGFKTYQNTVQCTPPNSQDLFLNVNHFEELLELQAQKSKVEDVAVWEMMNLHNRLITKHHETFWITVENRIVGNKEYFRYKEIEHTKNPVVNQFDVLLEQNMITVDLLLCRPSGNGDTYSFKIKTKAMPLLFPESVKYVI